MKGEGLGGGDWREKVRRRKEKGGEGVEERRREVRRKEGEKKRRRRGGIDVSRGGGNATERLLKWDGGSSAVEKTERRAERESYLLWESSEECRSLASSLEPSLAHGLENGRKEKLGRRR